MIADNFLSDMKYVVHKQRLYSVIQYVKDRLTERAKGKRTCHVCRCYIRPGERHLALYKRTYSFWGWRSNVCVFCTEILVREMKKDIKGGIKARKVDREHELFINSL